MRRPACEDSPETRPDIRRVRSAVQRWQTRHYCQSSHRGPGLFVGMVQGLTHEERKRTMHAKCQTCHCCTVDAAGRCIGGCETDEHPEAMTCGACEGTGTVMRCQDDACRSSGACLWQGTGCWEVCRQCQGAGA